MEMRKRWSRTPLAPSNTPPPGILLAPPCTSLAPPSTPQAPLSTLLAPSAPSWHPLAPLWHPLAPSWHPLAPLWHPLAPPWHPLAPVPTLTLTFWSNPSIWLSSSSRILCTSRSAAARQRAPGLAPAGWHQQAGTHGHCPPNPAPGTPLRSLLQAGEGQEVPCRPHPKPLDAHPRVPKPQPYLHALPGASSAHPKVPIPVPTPRGHSPPPLYVNHSCDHYTLQCPPRGAHPEVPAPCPSPGGAHHHHSLSADHSCGRCACSAHPEVPAARCPP